MSRNKIIGMIRQNAPQSGSFSVWRKEKTETPVARLKEMFKDNLTRVGAAFSELLGKDQLYAFINVNYPDALCFEREEVWKEYQAASPDKLDKLGTVLLNGQFGVAENGAIWLDESDFPNRLIPFIARELIISLPSGQIVEDMHQAYERIDPIGSGFGLFISGPSKTADIEQSLVYGAHGPVTLTVVLY